MAGRRSAARILIGLAILTLVVSVVGVSATLILNAFVLDKYDPAKRDGRSIEPNFMPSLEFGTQNKARQFVLQKLLDKGCISVADARLRQDEYDRIAATLAATNTTNG